MVMLLRPINDADHGWLHSLHNDEAVLRNLTHPEPITFEQHMQWWNSIKDNPRQLRLVFMVDGQRVGFTKFYDIDNTNHNCVLGADIHRDHRGKGLARPMWELMLKRCFGDLCLHRVSLTTAEYNHVARHVYEKLGFKKEGRLVQSLYRDGQYWDQVTMYMLQDDWKELQSDKR